MPKRQDIHTILVIGSGPIVIGQACEFDYSGTQGCKALREEGYRVVLINSNPATIMTDPEIADRTYIEPMTIENLEQIIEREKPDVLLPDARRPDGAEPRRRARRARRAREARRGVDRREPRGDPQGRGPAAVPGGDAADRARMCRARASPLRSKTLGASLDGHGLPAIIRPSFTLGGTGGGIAFHESEFDSRVDVGALAVAASPVPDRGERARLEGVRARGDARPRRTTW